MTACLHERQGARRYEGAERVEVPGWYVHRDPEDDRPSQLMVQRKEGSQRCNSYA